MKHNNMSTKTTNAYFALSLLPLFLIGCDWKKDKQIDTRSFVSPDGNILAIRVGPESEQFHNSGPDSKSCEVVLLELEGTSFKRHQPVKTQHGAWLRMAWNTVSTDELYFATICTRRRTYFGSPLSDGSFMKVESTIDGHLLTEIHSLGNYPNLSSAFSWSPDGTVIVGLATEFPHQILKGKLAFSFDGGKNVELTDITIFDRTPAWIDNNELYIQPDNKTIMKIARDGHDFKILEKTIESENHIVLCGSIKGAPVYRMLSKISQFRDKVFLGNQVVLQASDKINFIKAEKYIVVGFGGKVEIFDEDLSLCHERLLPENSRVLDFSPKTNVVFLLQDWKTVLCYDFKTQEEPSLLFSVDLMDE